MTRNRKWKLVFSVMIVIVIFVFFIKKKETSATKEVVRVISPTIGSIQSSISATATVQPQNRLEMKPPINGRIEEILVKEGEKVKAGQIVAWMSSTERAALLDAARAQGEEAVKYWEDVYKPTPLMSPIDGEVIVSTDEPGQTVTSSDVVIVVSDRLIVQAQIDETDIGSVTLGQDVAIGLDAYPQIKVNGKVDHIYYESKIVNNVTIYQVDIIPETVPAVFRSGMSAGVNIIEKTKDNVLVVPTDAVKRRKDGNYVLVSQDAGGKNTEKKVELGLSDEKNVEIVSGLDVNDKILIVTKKIVASSDKQQSSPLLPMGGGRH